MNLKQKLVVGASVLALTLSSVPAAFAMDWNQQDNGNWDKKAWKQVKKQPKHETRTWTPFTQDTDQYNIFYVNKLKIKQSGNNNTISWVFVNR